MILEQPVHQTTYRGSSNSEKSVGITRSMTNNDKPVALKRITAHHRRAVEFTGGTHQLPAERIMTSSPETRKHRVGRLQNGSAVLFLGPYVSQAS